MTSNQLYTHRKQKQEIEKIKGYSEFNYRLRMSQWDEPTKDWNLRLNALIQFHSAQSTNQILDRASKGTNQK
jgi:hypothetical protein